MTQRERWREWQKANKRWQRQLRAMKQRGVGIKIDPRKTGLRIIDEYKR